MKYALGFNIFLEQLLFYDRQEEKGRVKTPPVMHLGGGAWNMAKTLEAFLGRKDGISVLAAGPIHKSPQSAALATLLKKEHISVTTIPFKERVLSSYYLIPVHGKTWAFGDTGGKSALLSTTLRQSIERFAKHAEIRIACEISDDITEQEAARILLKKYRTSQYSVLVPSINLIYSKKIKLFLDCLDLLSMNENEALVFFGGIPSKEDFMRVRVPHFLLTRGAREAWLKVNHQFYKFKPRAVQNPPFIGGAGDATTAALIFKLFYEKDSPAKALRFAMEKGRETLFLSTPYWHGN